MGGLIKLITIMCFLFSFLNGNSAKSFTTLLIFFYIFGLFLYSFFFIFIFADSGFIKNILVFYLPEPITNTKRKKKTKLKPIVHKDQDLSPQNVICFFNSYEIVTESDINHSKSN